MTREAAVNTSAKSGRTPAEELAIRRRTGIFNVRRMILGEGSALMEPLTGRFRLLSRISELFHRTDNGGIL